jgi:hypothetical protein
MLKSNKNQRKCVKAPNSTVQAPVSSSSSSSCSGSVVRRYRGPTKTPRTSPGQSRIPLWDYRRSVKISGFASPMEKNLGFYLLEHPDCELYDRNKHRSAQEREKDLDCKLSEMESQELERLRVVASYQKRLLLEVQCTLPGSDWAALKGENKQKIMEMIVNQIIVSKREQEKIDNKNKEKIKCKIEEESESDSESDSNSESNSDSDSDSDSDSECFQSNKLQPHSESNSDLSSSSTSETSLLPPPLEAQEQAESPLDLQFQLSSDFTVGSKRKCMRVSLSARDHTHPHASPVALSSPLPHHCWESSSSSSSISDWSAAADAYENSPFVKRARYNDHWTSTGDYDSTSAYAHADAYSSSFASPCLHPDTSYDYFTSDLFASQSVEAGEFSSFNFSSEAITESMLDSEEKVEEIHSSVKSQPAESAALPVSLVTELSSDPIPVSLSLSVPVPVSALQSDSESESAPVSSPPSPYSRPSTACSGEFEFDCEEEQRESQAALTLTDKLMRMRASPIELTSTTYWPFVPSVNVSAPEFVSPCFPSAGDVQLAKLNLLQRRWQWQQHAENSQLVEQFVNAQQHLLQLQQIQAQTASNQMLAIASWINAHQH